MMSAFPIFCLRFPVRIRTLVLSACVCILAYHPARSAEQSGKETELHHGLTLLRQGQLNQAKVVLKKLHTAYPDDPSIQLGYARTMENAALACSTYRAVAANEQAEDSLRADAVCLLGMYEYINGNYEAAAELFTKSCTLRATSCCTQWYERSRARIEGRSGFDTGKLGFSDIEVTDERAVVTPQPAIDTAGGFTIQVGSFSSNANAQKLKERLSKDFSDICIRKARIGLRSFYRVRIGSFTTREQAQAYADRYLAGRDISYKAVPKGD
jgi:hypothetical protein